ncbi:MAG: WxcM-like domain-containing protein [Patescibacteria group bacterium]|nr:WxcM-like domain-containing protein [Patescibacteria group bacterium]
MEIVDLKLESAKKVLTYDAQGRQNGWLMELYKDKETGQKTEAYLTAALPGAFKGYHLHRVRAARYVAVKGRMRIICYRQQNNEWKPEEFILSADQPQRLFIPKNVATGLENIGSEEAWLINYPDPAYDPSLKDEQVEYTKEELEKGVIK